MVRGLGIFKEYFAGHESDYILIGGTAASLAMEDAGLAFRTTKDLDIVLCVEALNRDFAKIFWNFIKAGGYKNCQQSMGRRLFYRFYEPKDTMFPHMLELFSRLPDVLELDPHAAITPVPIEGEAASLSAILLEPEYYDFVLAGRRTTHGISTIGPDRLIPLKAHAWLDLRTRKESGEIIDSEDIKKHRNDIFRLSRIIDPANHIIAAEKVKVDLSKAFSALRKEPNINLKVFGIQTMTLLDIVEMLEEIYLLS